MLLQRLLVPSLCVCLLPLLLWADDKAPEAARTNPLAGDKTAIAAGGARFRSGCAMCHGGNAEGGRGPKLVDNWQLYRMPDQQLFGIIQHGIPGTSMPASNLPDRNVWELAAYVRSLSSPAAVTITDGDPTLGRALFYGKAKCSQCHAILGQGGTLGPDLSDAGARLTALNLRKSIEDPSAEIAPGFEYVTVKTRTGSLIEGVAKENSDYSLAVLDRSGALHRWQKADLESVEVHKESLMPTGLAQNLTPEEFTNLLAFVAKQALRPVDPAAPRHRTEE